MLFIGAVGKSGQFGFMLGFQEAMNAPTPVSALLHAATMVK
jgi:NADH:ubiquinone oxidoreductase subunit 5 (subunit L)/multisubunit Na+/H+ antiporter MnhA subunit